MRDMATHHLWHHGDRHWRSSASRRKLATEWPRTPVTVNSHPWSTGESPPGCMAGARSTLKPSPQQQARNAHSIDVDSADDLDARDIPGRRFGGG